MGMASKKLISASYGFLKRALSEMDGGRKVDNATYAALIRWCAEEKALAHGRRVHAHMAASGKHHNTFLGNLLVMMYGKCGTTIHAWEAFSQLHRPNIYSWNLMIAAFAQNGEEAQALHLLRQLEREGPSPNTFTFLPIITASSSLHSLKQTHECIIFHGLQTELLLRNALVSMYGKFGGLQDARLLFDKAPQRDLVLWNAMIGAYAQNGHGDKALELFRKMKSDGIEPDWITFLSTLDACASLGSIEKGRAIHQQIMSSRSASNVAVKTALVNMYGKCGSIKDARAVFDEIHLLDVISWTAMITAYAQNGYGEEALELFKRIDAEGIKPDMITFISALDACANLASLKDGKMVHKQILASGFISDVAVRCALVHMYGKCGSLKDARRIFDELCEQDMILWSAMIAAYAQNECGKEALDLFLQMNSKGMKPNWITFISALDACSTLSSLAKGKMVHDQIIGSGIGFNITLWNALLNMYGKCGSLKDAKVVFDEIHERNVISWTSMIAAYAQNGRGKEALELFEEMEAQDANPNDVTFVTILNACTHMGLLNAGQKYFVAMTANHTMTPSQEHFICMSNLLGRVGRLEEAEELIINMPTQPSAVAWTTLLGGCRTYGDMQSGVRAAERIFELDPGDVSNYVLLSNLYAAAGRWLDASKVEKAWKGG